VRRGPADAAAGVFPPTPSRIAAIDALARVGPAPHSPTREAVRRGVHERHDE
jgi:hypothetical protein